MRKSVNVKKYLLHVVNAIRVNSGRSEFDGLLPTHYLQEDLGLDSLELAEMTVVIEAEFGVDVFEDGVAATVQDVLDRIET